MDDALAAGRHTGMESCQGLSSLKEKLAKEAPAINWTLAFSGIMDKVNDLLDVGIPDILVLAWNKHGMLRKYLDKGKYPPNETVMAHLAEHTIKSVHQPYIEIWISDRNLGKIDFNINLTLTIKGAILKIQDGSIKEICTGSCKGKGILSCEEFIIIEKETESISLPGSISFPKGIPIALAGQH
jgi:hypothetical protein